MPAAEFLHAANPFLDANHIQQKTSDCHIHSKRGTEYVWVVFLETGIVLVQKPLRT